jgi:hypothetical protein
VNLELDPDAGYEWHDRELHIMRAYYGGEGYFVNVTEQLRSMKRDGGYLSSSTIAAWAAIPTRGSTRSCAFCTGTTDNAGRSWYRNMLNCDCPRLSFDYALQETCGREEFILPSACFSIPEKITSPRVFSLSLSFCNSAIDSRPRWE